MRLAIAILVIAGALLALGFDHTFHARDVDVAGKDPIACMHCHASKDGLLVGRPDHRACFGACHGPAPTKPKRGDKLVIAPERLALCTSCHTQETLERPVGAKVAVPYPPYTADDFALAVGHKRHGEVACATCHTSSAKSRTPHRRCIGCHDGSGAPGRGPAMTACEGCHTPGIGAPLPPKLEVPRNTVSAVFSHGKHAARGTAGATCMTCHAALLETDDSILPRPTATTCAVGGCHDGKPTFSIMASCRSCHTAPAGKYEIQRHYETRFSHTLPAHADAKLPCAACHPLSPGGEVLVASHGACASCHADQFMARHPTMCFACHNSTEPWRALTADRGPRETTEFGASLDHSKHASTCGSCHTLRTASAQLRPPRGHRACTTSGCHAVSGGPSPRLGECEQCHELGLASRRTATRIATTWSVRATFDHAPHQRARDGAEVACTTCHVDLRGPGLLALPAPPKQTCVGCHNGAIAFEITGTGCRRCHGGVSAAASVR